MSQISLRAFKQIYKHCFLLNNMVTLKTVGRKRNYKIQDVMISYENLQVKINGKWVYMKIDKLKGLNIKGKVVKKRVRTWLE